MGELIQRRHCHQDPVTGIVTDVIQTWARISGTDCWILIGVETLIESMEPPL